MIDQTPACPVCDSPIVPAAGTVASEIIPCPDCGCDLEVKCLDPFTLAEAPQEEEDWGE